MASRPQNTVAAVSRDASLRQGRDAPIRPEDFPRGFTEQQDQPATFPALLFELAYGEIFDAGIHYYGEFFANLEYGWDLLHSDNVSVNGSKGHVRVVDRYANGVQLKWRAA